MTYCRIQGVATAVPKQVVTNDRFFEIMGGEAQANRVFASVGIRERRWAPAGTTALDLCVSAAERLLDEAKVGRDQVSAVVMVTQTPDFAAPASACLAQARLGIAQQCMAFDVNQGCAGFMYGLAIAKGLVSARLADRVLLLVGDTSSQTCNPQDPGTLPLFGDSGTACLVERADLPGIHEFHFATDGSGWNVLVTPTGGRRFPTEADFHARASAHDREYLRFPAHVNMDGSKVFSFCMENVPALIAATLQANGLTSEDIQYTAFHQANLMMMEAIRRKAKLPKESFLVSLGEFGNTSVASIPVTLTHAADRLREGGKVLMAGFGIGLSLAGTVVTLDPSVVFPPLVEV